MQSDHHFHPRKSQPQFAHQGGNANYMNIPVASSFAAALPSTENHLMPVHGIEFQPSEVCPRNFIIFDQTDHRSQVMFHPAVAHKFNNPNLNIYSSFHQETFERKEVNINDIETEISSSLKEDSDDIEALLSLEEEEEQDEYDEDEVSTARTYGNYGSNSPDSCSTYGSKSRKNGSSSSVQKSSGGGSGSNCERKKKKMKKMVKALRGIVPGGDQMNTVTVLDEAVRYLKSLKVEVQKLGVGSLKN